MPHALRGSLVRNIVPETSSSSSSDIPKLGIGSQLFQRDSGRPYTIENIYVTRHAPNGLAILRGPDGETVSRSLDFLNEIIDQEDGSWRR